MARERRDQEPRAFGESCATGLEKSDESYLLAEVLGATRDCAIPEIEEEIIETDRTASTTGVGVEVEDVEDVEKDRHDLGMVEFFKCERRALTTSPDPSSSATRCLGVPGLTLGRVFIA